MDAAIEGARSDGEDILGDETRVELENPYEAPGLAEPRPAGRPLRLGWRPVWWLFLFLLNLPLAVIFGWSETADGARVGMIVVAMSQCFPLAHIVAGLIGLLIAGALGLGQDGAGDEGLPRLTSLLGGLVATVVTGGLLIGTAFVVGLVLRAMTPADWWGSSRFDPQEAEPGRTLESGEGNATTPAP